MWGTMVRIRVLGPIEAEINSRTVNLGGPRQRAVLAMLLSARRGVVSVDRLIDDLWHGEPPPSATASLQAYVSNLRRLLEPDRPPRAPARLLVSAPPGYAVRLGDDAVDAWRFERLVRQARRLGRSDPAVARALLDEAVGLWHGQAYAEVADEPWAVAEAARLEELRLAACESLVEMTLRAGAAAEAVPAAEVLTRQQPLREESWRLLALALWGSGRQADALAALRRSRRTLAEELGLDPGPGLVELEGAILAQRTEVLHASLGRPEDAPDPAASASEAHPPAAEATGPAEVFVGREAELAALAAAASAVRPHGSQVVLVTGDAGVGKSALLDRLRRVLESDGWLVAVGRCPEAEGAPPAWAWVEGLRSLAQRVPPGDLAGPLAPLLQEGQPEGTELEASAGRFRLHRAVGAWLRAAASSRPLAVVLDDLHGADAETLALLDSTAEQLVEAPVLLVAAFRPTDAGERLEETLARLARRSPRRLPLGGLPSSQVDTLVRALHDGPLDPATVSALAERTGGNPFYVRESVRLLASEGALIALSEVPEGVRDVLRRRLARLPPTAASVLRLAAVVGRDADVEVLVQAAGTDEPAVLDALEAGLIAGLLTEPAPGKVRFVHALVRDTIYTDLSRLRRARLHARVAAVLERLHPDELSALAHHYARASSSHTAVKAVDYAIRAAEVAERRYAHDAAVELLAGALECHERIPPGTSTPGGERVPGDRDAERVDLLGRLLRAQVRAGAVAAARATRERAVDLAEGASRDDLLVAAFAAWTEPTPWQARPYGMVDQRTVAMLVRLLRRPDLDPVSRCRLLDALVVELAGEGDPRAAAAAREAVVLARGVGDPGLLALALSAEAWETSWDREPGRRVRLAEEIGQIGSEQELVAYRWCAEHIAATAAGARGDLPGLRHHIGRGLELAAAYRMAEPLAIGLCAQAMLAHVAGRFEEAETGYAEACAQMLRHGSLHAEGFGVLATVTMRVSQRRMAEYAPAAEMLVSRYGRDAMDAVALALTAAGHHEEARAVLSEASPLRPDFYLSIFATLRAMAVVALGRREQAEELYAALLPRRDQLAGVASTSLAMRPVAHTLGELAELLGRHAAAVEHLAEAVAVAQAWEARHWEAEARAAVAALRAGLR
jgi:DNA-binding SARP family transcriptional activator/tetratricopeptide (TPR) repeat protein